MVQEKDLNKSEYKIRLSKPYIGDKEEILKLIGEILETGYLTQGKYVAKLEEKIANYLGVKYAIALSSGTSALHLSLISLDIGPDDEVIVPAYTFPATANVVELVGAKPVFIDVELNTYNINVKKIEEVISSKTKAIIPVHLFGNPCNMEPIINISRETGIKVIEDAAGAFGSIYKGERCGTIGDIGCFSFHPRKIITTGEGGVIVTNNDEIAEKILQLRNHGMKKEESRYDFVLAGFNYRMNELEAVLGINQIAEIEKIINERQDTAKLYMDLLKDVPDIAFQQTLPNSTTVWQAFVIRLKSKENKTVLDFLKNEGIEVNIGTYALHILTYYSKKYGYSPEDYPNAYELYTKSIALPFYNEISETEIRHVVEILRGVL